MKLHVALLQQNTDSDSMITKRGLEEMEVKEELSSIFFPVVYYLDQLVTIAVSMGSNPIQSQPLPFLSMYTA